MVDLVQFDKDPVKLGKINKVKTISEAVVAVPFVEENGVRKFFEIPQSVVDVALNKTEAKAEDDSDKAGLTIIDMVNKMNKYVMPPTFDFVNNSEVTPISMYIFEFTHNLDQNDLSYIWQNLSPKIGVETKKVTSKINHKLLFNELMGHSNSNKNRTFDTKVQWLVFKVKQKANSDYYQDLHSDTIQINKLNFKQSIKTSKKEKYSYNWPYDYFSLVELVNLDCDITISNFEETDISVKVPSPSIKVSNIGSELKIADLSTTNPLTKLNNTNIDDYKKDNMASDKLNKTLNNTVAKLNKK